MTGSLEHIRWYHNRQSALLSDGTPPQHRPPPPPPPPPASSFRDIAAPAGRRVETGERGVGRVCGRPCQESEPPGSQEPCKSHWWPRVGCARSCVNWRVGWDGLSLLTFVVVRMTLARRARAGV